MICNRRTYLAAVTGAAVLALFGIVMQSETLVIRSQRFYLLQTSITHCADLVLGPHGGWRIE